jgi:hypothetical protein
MVTLPFANVLTFSIVAIFFSCACPLMLNRQIVANNAIALKYFITDTAILLSS